MISLSDAKELYSALLRDSQYDFDLLHLATGEQIEEIVDFYQGQTHMVKLALKRIISGEQIEYILGQVKYHNIMLKIDKRAYIPQSDSVFLYHYLCDRVSELYHILERPVNVLEVGTGSGAISCALGINIPSLLGKLGASDIDGSALRLARENFNYHNLKVSITETDGLEGIEDINAYDIIFCYPPWGDSSPDEVYFEGSDWEIFHKSMPQISCYPYGGVTGAHDKIIADAESLNFHGDIVFFNDIMPDYLIDSIVRKLHAPVITHSLGNSVLRGKIKRNQNLPQC